MYNKKTTSSLFFGDDGEKIASIKRIMGDMKHTIGVKYNLICSSLLKNRCNKLNSRISNKNKSEILDICKGFIYITFNITFNISPKNM